MELIDKKELLTKIKNLPSQNGGLCAAQVLFVMQNQKTPWLSVKDKQPEYGQLVLACTNYTPMITDRNILISVYEFQDYWEDGTITHWMSLPDLPDEYRTKGDLT